MSQFENIDQINISKNDNFSNFMAKYQPKNYPPNLSSNKINDNSSLLSDKTYLENDEKIEKGYEQYLNKTGLEKIIKQSNPNPSNKENYPMTNEASSNYIKNENKQSSVNKLIDIKRQVDMFLQPDNESSWQNERLDFIKLQHKYKGIHWECLMENRIEALRVLSIVLYNNQESQQKQFFARENQKLSFGYNKSDNSDKDKQDQIKKLTKKTKKLKNSNQEQISLINQKDIGLQFMKQCITDLCGILDSFCSIDHLKNLIPKTKSSSFEFMEKNEFEENIQQNLLGISSKIDFLKQWVQGQSSGLENDFWESSESRAEYNQSYDYLLDNIKSYHTSIGELFSNNVNINNNSSQKILNLQNEFDKIIKTKNTQDKYINELEEKSSTLENLKEFLKEIEKDKNDLSEELLTKETKNQQLEDEIVDLRESVENEREELIKYLENVFEEIFEPACKKTSSQDGSSGNEIYDQQQVPDKDDIATVLLNKQTGYTSIDSLINKIGSWLKYNKRDEKKYNFQFRAIMSQYLEVAQPLLKILDMLSRMSVHDIPASQIYFKESMISEKSNLLQNIQNYKRLLGEQNDSNGFVQNSEIIEEISQKYISIFDENVEQKNLVESLRNKLENIILENESLKLMVSTSNADKNNGNKWKTLRQVSRGRSLSGRYGGVSGGDKGEILGSLNVGGCLLGQAAGQDLTMNTGNMMFSSVALQNNDIGDSSEANWLNMLQTQSLAIEGLINKFNQA